ncbi:MAG: twin-arginine translocase subunit TatC [Bacteroidales bacterium]|nr:twin-arginine translocase subunit TatC [Bacteroidales bacterium]
MAEEKEMTFWDHLDVLRGTLFRSAAAIFAVSIVFLCIKTSLFRFVLAPTTPDFFLYKLLGLDFSISLVNIDISAQFFVHLKIALLCGVIVAFPYVIFEIWKFIAPALYSNEKKAVRKAFGMASVLFYLGVAVGYTVILPVCLMFFMNYTVSDAVLNTITLNSYISMFVSMVFLIGLVFEFPTVIMVLSSLGIVNKTMLRSYRKHAFIVIMIIAALITPSDPVSMFVLGIPLYMLYEFSIYVSREAPAEE